MERPALLAGERPDGTVGTARRWLNVYADLVRFVDRAVTEAGDQGLRSSMLRKRRDFRRRMVFWEGELRRALVARSED